MSIPKPNQHTGPLAGHVRKGRVYKSPLAATGMLRPNNWFKDDVPDLLWPVLVLAEQGNEGIHRFVGWQQAVQDRLAHHGESSVIAELLDGRLTHLSDLVAMFPDATAILFEEANRQGLLSENTRRVLGSYPFMPAAWLAGETERTPPAAADLELAHDALLGVLQDGHREALIKCFRTWSTVHAGTFSSNAQTIQLLKYYPGDIQTRSAADSVVRAGWAAHKAMLLVSDPKHFDHALKWARMFWTANSMTSGCVRETNTEDDYADDMEPEEPANTERELDNRPVEHASPTPVPADGAHLRQSTMDVLIRFIEAIERAPGHLYEKERQEVILGLVARAGRDLIAVLSAPDLWCMEHGAHITRMLVETEIYLKWMALQDPSIYREFQAYGAGKAKLYARISDELPEEARTAAYREAAEELKRLSHNNDVVDDRTVDTRDTFAGGKSLRAMAQEAGLLDFYRQAYTLASSVAHSEWWSIEAHAMEPCQNVLHGLHLIPSLSLSYGGNVQFASSWVDQFHSLARAALSVLGADQDSVAVASAWLGWPASEQVCSEPA
ncbi:DUF5677 domain-containing protein [Arthrobacter sp. NtRootA1]|uniref:DUF5677 domain-containing protein n=1 Tax=Arthrobacter sp. NtRootA1 TaxID=2830983 RepID=UPI001CC4779B|nr:DUF5677 domain-containing protein [Arthrobacter sp. NtRootA1]